MYINLYKGRENREEVVFEREAAVIALNKSFVVTIPIEFIRANKIRAGDRVVLRYDQAGVRPRGGAAAMSESADRPPDPLDRPGLSETQVRRLVQERLRELTRERGAAAIGSTYCAHHYWLAEEIAKREGLGLVLEGAYQQAQAETVIAHCAAPEETPGETCGCLADWRLVEKKRHGRARS